jgi:hypothetical protein
MSDLSRYVELYRLTTEHDTEVLWSKVNIIREAIADGADVETLLTECGKESGDSAKQVRKFYAVAMIWGNDEIAVAANYDYWLYEVAATAPGVIPDEPGTHFIARKWIKEVENRQIKRGKKTIHAKHTARTLRAAIRAANGDGKPKETVVRNVQATYHGYERFAYTLSLTISVDNTDEMRDLLSNLHRGSDVQLTITRETRVPPPATAPAEAESEVDAA